MPFWRAFVLGIVAAELGSIELVATSIVAPALVGGGSPPSAGLIGLELTFGTVFCLMAVPATVPVLWAAIHLLRRLHDHPRSRSWLAVAAAIAVEAGVVGVVLASRQA